MSWGHSHDGSFDSNGSDQGRPRAQFSMDEEVIERREYPAGIQGRAAHNDTDIEFLKFLNFNTAVKTQTRFDFEISEQRPAGFSASENEDGSRRSRSREKQRYQDRVTGGDLRRLFGDEKLVAPRKCGSSKCLGKKDEEMMTEDDVSDGRTGQHKRTANGIAGVFLETLRCNCPKSKCLKLYCSCYSNGLPCTEACTCRECQNTVGLHEGNLKPPKTEGCNCKMTYCEKNYCTCARTQKGCGVHCTCYACKNAFGIKPKK